MTRTNHLQEEGDLKLYFYSAINCVSLTVFAKVSNDYDEIKDDRNQVNHGRLGGIPK